MNALRRPEVITLMVLVLAGVGWVVVDSLRKPGRPGERGRDHRIEITKVAVMPEGRHQRLRLELTGFNSSATPMEMRPPTVRLLDSSGKAIPEFFQPGAFPPPLPPQIKSATWLEFWLREDQSRHPLFLEVAGRQLPVPIPQ
ncbi:MAG: hypothetical protein ACR2OZ_06800 [Verrucomicrobiales bacterium]